MINEVLPFVATAAITSLPWAIVYRSQTKWLREGWNWSVARHDETKTLLACEKVETENLAATCDMLRKANNSLREEVDQLAAFKAQRNKSRRQREAEKVAA